MKDGTIEYDQLDAAAFGADGTVIVGGWTFGDWGGALAGVQDPIAVKLAANGTLLWRYQVRLGKEGRLATTFIVSVSGGVEKKIQNISEAAVARRETSERCE